MCTSVEYKAILVFLPLWTLFWIKCSTCSLGHYRDIYKCVIFTCTTLSIRIKLKALFAKTLSAIRRISAKMTTTFLFTFVWKRKCFFFILETSWYFSSHTNIYQFSFGCATYVELFSVDLCHTPPRSTAVVLQRYWTRRQNHCVCLDTELRSPGTWSSRRHPGKEFQYWGRFISYVCQLLVSCFFGDFMIYCYKDYLQTLYKVRPLIRM